jgi:hypothetical protein
MSRCTDRSARPNNLWLPPRHSQHAGIGVRSHSAARGRRGVLLLVVLSMLTLFLMLGAAYLLAASRARDAAKAYARLTFGSDEARIPAPALLDSVLLRVVRGPIVIGSGTFESLLADKYGGPIASGTPTLSGSLSNIARSGPVLTGSFTMLPTSGSVRPTDLAGRVLTLSSPGRPSTSHRIVRAVNSGPTNVAGTAFTLALDLPFTNRPFTLPSGPMPAIVNGREFSGVPSLSPPSNENWDGFDEHNRFLAQLRSSTTSISQADVVRGSFLHTSNAPTFSVSGTTYTLTTSATSASVFLVTGATDLDNDLITDAADNDGDGVIDGIFQNIGLPDASDAAGNAVQLRASILVVDLDGRFNVNAHDALPRLIYAGTSNWSTVSSATAAPLGSGYGPAEINGMSGTRAWTSNSTSTPESGLFPGRPVGAPLITRSTLDTSENPTIFTLTGGGTLQLAGQRSGISGSRYSDGESTPQLSNIEGRYGERGSGAWANIVPNLLGSANPANYALPGAPLVDDGASRLNDRRTISLTASDNFGVPSIWWTGTTGFSWGTSPTVAGTSQPLPRGTFNSPPDLHGRMRTITGSAVGSGTIVPQLQFAKAEWDDDTMTIGARETTDDPYELRLDTRRGFGGLLFDPTTAGSGTSTSSLARDNPFTPAELESVLRPYDVDTAKLPPRLAAMLGSVAEEARLKITTDSWDTTAITGSAARLLFGPSGSNTGWLQQVTGTIYSVTSPVEGIIANEVSRGERFDLNRPLAASGPTTTGYSATSTYALQRQAYCKDLYTLLVALSSTNGVASLNGGTITGTAATAVLAQWTANVAEFRDADSRMMPFEYDTDPLNGWSVDGDVTTGTDSLVVTGTEQRAVVWGMERPEIVIRETFGWRAFGSGLGSGSSGVVVSLHRPWNATAYGSGSTSAIAAEPCDYCLDSLANGTSGAAQNRVNLGKKPDPSIYGATYSAANVLDNSGTVYPIWRLRIVTSDTNYVAFTGTNSVAGTAGGWTGADSIVSGTQAPRLPVETSFTVYTGGTIRTGTSGTSSVFLSISGSSLAMPLLTLATTASGTVFLERLSDPTVRLTTTGTLPSGAGTVTGSTIWTADPLTTSGTTWPVKYIVIDTMPLTVISTTTSPDIANFTTRVRSTTSGSAFWGEKANSPTFTWNASTTGTLPTASTWTSGSSRWLPWPNRPFVSSAELTLVPQGDANSFLQNYRPLTPALSGTAGTGLGIPVAPSVLFDAVHVPTRFAAIHSTGTNDVSTSTGIFNSVTTVNQLSSFREPGRVNLNTVPSDDVWNAVVAGQLPSPLVSRTASTITTSGTAAQNMYATLSLASGTGTTIVSDTTSAQLAVNLNPLHGIYTATRLANTSTPRSNVFGVWITLRQSIPNDPDSVRYHRAFYIVDRSIPVGFEEGKDHNVWDCVRLRRIIE